MILNYYDEQNKIDDDILNEYEIASKVIINKELGVNLRFELIEISLNIVTEDEIKEINREYRGIDKSTDVLSFPQYENIQMIMSKIKDLKALEQNNQMPLILGDIVICFDVAKRQSIEYGNTIKRELVYLFVHSMLHLLGYDHIKEDDRKIMRRHEEEIMSELGIER